MRWISLIAGMMPAVGTSSRPARLVRPLGVSLCEHARGEPREPSRRRRPDWYKDAIIYELHVRAFCDSDGDGIGDFRGLTAKLDYLQDLGVTALWLLPFYPSPLRDDGYDIADYTRRPPDVRHARATSSASCARRTDRGLRVITELVLNHTSDQHPWFQRARRAPRRAAAGATSTSGATRPTRYREARIIFKDFETSNWTWDPVAKAYYWHRFYSHQPDLNFDNPAVRRGDARRWSTSGSAWASTACAWTPCRTSTSARAPTARTCPRRTPS